MSAAHGVERGVGIPEMPSKTRTTPRRYTMARTLTPFHEVDRLFSDLTRTPASVGMPMDLYRDGDNFVAQVDLPGVDPASIDVDVEDRTLTVRAERTSATGAQVRTWLTRERPSGTSTRQLTLGSR